MNSNDLIPALSVHTHIALGTSEEDVATIVKHMEQMGWKASGFLMTIRTIKQVTYARALVSITAVAAVPGSPRVLLTNHERKLEMPAAPIVDLLPGQFRITHFQDYNYQWHEYPYTGNTKYTKESVERLWPTTFKGLAISTQLVQALRFTGGIEYHGFGDWITPAPGQPVPPSDATNNPIPLTGVLVIRVDRATGQVLNSFVEYK